jgi:CheY-like chemotaxis protein
MAGWDVSMARNGREALALAGENRFDVVISDYGMPEIVGTDLLRTLRHDPGYADTPMILMSAYSHDLNMPALRDELRLTAFFSKPFSPAELVRIVENCRRPDATLEPTPST